MSATKRPREDAAPEQRCRYLKFTNLPHGCTSDELSSLLDPLGKVEEIRVKRDDGGGMMALIEMSCTREATSAKRRLNEMPLRGSDLCVIFDNSRTEVAPPTDFVFGAPAAGAPAPSSDKAAAPAAPSGQQQQFMGTGSKLPPFYVPERMMRDVGNHMVIKMRSVLWTAKEDDIRDFYRGLHLERDSIEMGRDHAGRFSGMVYVRFRSAADASAAMRRGSDYLCGRSVILSRVDLSTPGIAPVPPPSAPNSAPPAPPSRTPAPPPPPRPAAVFEPRPWPATGTLKPASKPAGPAPSGYVGVQLCVASADKGMEPGLSAALASAPVSESLAAVRHFLTKDERLPPSTRNAAVFLDALRAKLLENPAQSEASPVGRHLFRSPFEQAGVIGYSLPEVEHIFGTRSSDSVFWPIFSTFHTLLPHQVEEPVPDESLEDFING